MAMSLEEQIISLARSVADETWGTGPDTMHGSISIKRVEQTSPDEWRAFYTEPDTLTEDYVTIMRSGDSLYAYEGAEIVAEAEIEGPGKADREIAVKSAVIDWQAGRLDLVGQDGGKHMIALDAPIHVEMIGFPDPVALDLRAAELGDYMSKGYMILKIRYEA